MQQEQVLTQLTTALEAERALAELVVTADNRIRLGFDVVDKNLSAAILAISADEPITLDQLNQEEEAIAEIEEAAGDIPEVPVPVSSLYQGEPFEVSASFLVEGPDLDLSESDRANIFA